MTQNVVKDEIRWIVKTIALIDEHTKWVSCPACHEEWTKLRPCSYFSAGALSVSSICVSCAESVKSIRWFQELYPIDGIEIATFLDRAYRFYPQSFISDKMFCAIVRYGAMRFKFYSRDTHVFVQREDKQEEPTSYDNMYQAWIATKTKIANGDSTDVEPIKGWDKVKKGRKTALFGESED